MSEEERSSVQRQLRSPRSAAVAGIVYSVLMMLGLVFAARVIRAKPEDITKE